MAFVLRCPKCRDTFPYSASDGMPDICPLCKEFVGSGDNTVISMPMIRSAKTKSADKLYRDMERGSEVRASKAAEMLGIDASDMSALKMTNMSDSAREGESSAPPLPVAADDMGKFFQPNGQEYGAGTASGAVTVNGKITTGIEPRAGATAMSNIQRLMGKG
jgi:hypothetical protein